mgnify:CR=1 FL=1|tara:strand:- start:934 stop:1656 length:723 start_codon:yes stop_codon:yes gene_type:complete
MDIFNNNNKINDDDKKTFIYNMMKYKEQKRSAFLKRKCVSALREYNNNYKCEIVNSYRNIVELDDENRWNEMPPHYYEMVVGYLIYNNNIIPYTEASSITTIHNVLLNDVRFNFVGDDNDLNFQYIICFLTSVGVVEPRDENDNLIFKVVSLFNGADTKEDIETYTSLTHFIQHRSNPSGIYGKTENYGFDFNIDKIVRYDDYRIYNKNRIKLTLTLLSNVLANKNKMIKPTEISDCLTS